MKTNVIELIDADLIERNGLKKVVCKFVIISRQDCLHLVIGRLVEYNYHANLVEAFCQRFSLPFSWIDRPAQGEINDSETKTRGGGWAEIDPERKQVTLFGRSTAYGRFIRTDLDLVLKEQTLLPEYDTFVRD